MKKMFVLALALLIMLCAAGAMAECTGKTGFTAGGTLTDGKYCLSESFTGNISINGNVILCLHGKTLNGRIQVEQGKKLTLEDCTEDQGRVVYEGNALKNFGTAIMTGGIIESTAGTNYCVYNYEADSSFTMTGGMLLAPRANGVYNYGSDSTFIMTGGIIQFGKSIGVNNNGSNSTFTMSGGSVQGDGTVGVVNSGTFTMSGSASVTGKGKGVQNNRYGTFRIAAGTIAATLENGVAVTGAEKDSILPGSKLTKGGFDQRQAVVEKVSQQGGAVGGAAAGTAGDLPQTGDPSMLGAWVCLLGAAGMGLKLKKR